MTLFPTGAAADRILGFLLIAAGVLLVATTAFAGLTVVLRVRYKRAQARSHALQERWRPLLLSALADPALEHELSSAVAPGEELYFLDQVWAFARRLRGAERETLIRIARPHLGVLIERTGSRDEDIRARAIQTLGVLGMPEHENVMLAALDDASTHVSMTAARALARREHPQHAPAVLARLDRFRTWNQRYLSAMLAGVGPESARYLRDILADGSRSEWSRTVCANALTALHDLEGGNIAGEILAKGAPPELTSSCAALLGATARTDHLPLLRRLANSQDYVVRMIALEAVAALGGAVDVPRLELALHDRSPWVALRAAYALEELGGSEILTRLAASDDERAVLAREVLGAKGS